LDSKGKQWVIPDVEKQCIGRGTYIYPSYELLSWAASRNAFSAGFQQSVSALSNLADSTLESMLLQLIQMVRGAIRHGNAAYFQVPHESMPRSLGEISALLGEKNLHLADMSACLFTKGALSASLSHALQQEGLLCLQPFHPGLHPLLPALPEVSWLAMQNAMDWKSAEEQLLLTLSSSTSAPDIACSDKVTATGEQGSGQLLWIRAGGKHSNNLVSNAFRLHLFTQSYDGK